MPVAMLKWWNQFCSRHVAIVILNRSPEKNHPDRAVFAMQLTKVKLQPRKISRYKSPKTKGKRANSFEQDDYDTTICQTFAAHIISAFVSTGFPRSPLLCMLSTHASVMQPWQAGE
jgi:hypothetical protein